MHSGIVEVDKIQSQHMIINMIKKKSIQVPICDSPSST